VPVEVVSRPSTGEGRVPGTREDFATGFVKLVVAGLGVTFDDSEILGELEAPDRPIFRLRNDIMSLFLRVDGEVTVP
jgi:hypothetical protein